MKRFFSAALFVALLSLTGSTSVSTEHTSIALDCDITIKGHHGGSSGSILFDFNLSEVKNQVGWWAQLGVGEYGYDRLTLEPGDLFSEVFNRDFSCNARRQYRLYFEATVEGRRYEYVHYYPAQGDHTRETVIELGDVSRFFDAIEPGPPIVTTQPTPETMETPVARLDLDGEWVRRESNNNPNDGMLINVSDGQAVLTYVPPTASSNWHEGEILWQNIGDDGTLEVLGSNNAYYDAEMITEGINTVHIDIDANGRGNDQSWERANPIASNETEPESEGGEEPVFADVEIAEACADQLQLDPTIAAIVDPIVRAEMVEQEIVGMAVGVVQGGAITYLKGHGYADRESGSPVDWRAIFRWASISKTLTAVAALSLWEDGDLLLHEDIRTYVPEYPAKPEGTITPFMTLSNTSGVRQYDSLNAVNHPYATRAANFSRDLPYDAVDAVGIFDDAPLIAPTMSPPFAPGNAYHYSTFGFNLAGAAVERAAEDAVDLSYTELIQERIADPLCMDSLQPDEPGRQSNFETRRYQKDRNNIVNREGDDDRDDDENILWKLPGGGYQSNIRDLALFARGLMERELLDDATHLLQETIVRSPYGLGIYNQMNDHDGNNATPATQRIGHGGDSPVGVRTAMYFYPDRDLGIVLLINSAHARRGRILNTLANALGAPWSNSDYSLTSSLNCDQNTQTGSGSRFAGVWQEGPTGQVIRRGYPHDLFAREREWLQTHGYHLTDLETFLEDGKRLWDGVFAPNIGQTRLFRNLDRNSFLQRISDERSNGYQLVDVEVYSGPGIMNQLWAGVFAQTPEQHELEFDLRSDELDDVWRQRASDGFRLVDIETYEMAPGARLWAGVFVEGTGGYGLYFDVPPERVDARRNDFARDGLRTIDVERYVGSQDQPLWALVAGPIDGNQTARVDKTFCGIWNGPFTGFWETHEDQARQGRSLIDFERYPVPVN